MGGERQRQVELADAQVGHRRQVAGHGAAGGVALALETRAFGGEPARQGARMEAEPGEGRLKTCVKANLSKLSETCLDAIFGPVVSDAPPAMRLSPGATPGREVRTAQARDRAHCEIAPVIRSGGAATAEFCDAADTTGPTAGWPRCRRR